METAEADYARFVELEAKEGIESFRWLATQLIHVATVLAVANITIVGYAASKNQAGFLLLGAFVTLLLLIAYMGGLVGVVPLLCRLLYLENETSIHLQRELDSSITLILLNILGPDFLEEARHVNELKSLGEKKREMSKLSKKLVTVMPTRIGIGLLLFAIIAQLVLIPVLVYIFNWKLL